MDQILNFRQADHSIRFIVFFSLVFLTNLLAGANNITDFGAVGDGKTLNTRAIQAAIDACAKSGGGTVEFPAGTWLSGTLYLKSHVNLNLNAGARLLGSTRVADYPLNHCKYPSWSDRYVGRALLWGEGLENVSITGRGTIDGQGHYFAENRVTANEYAELVKFYDDTTRYSPGPGEINRPYMLRLIGCRKILIENVTMQKSGMWLQHFLNCEFLTIRNVHIFNHGSRNNDMIDIDGCRNVVITGCYGDTDDDGITLKSTGTAPTENVTISDCIIRSRTNAIKAGTESSGGFKDITITNCIIQPSEVPDGFSGRNEGLAGIALEIVDGGTLDRVTISNITIEDMAAPLYLRLGNRARKFKPGLPTPPVGTFRNVRISNLIATRAGDTGCSILGIIGHPIENVSLSNVRIHFDGGGTRAHATAEIPEKDAEYPESTRFGPLPAYGFFCRHVTGLTFRDVILDFDAPELRPALVCNDVADLKLFNFNAEVAPNTPPVRLQTSREVFISDCRPVATDMFLRLELHCEKISVIGNDFSQVPQPFSLDETVQMSAIDAIGNLPEPRAKQVLFTQLVPLVRRDELGIVTMKSFTPDSEIRFTRDGTIPTHSSDKYSQPFEQISAVQIRARVFQGNLASRTAVVDFAQLPVIQPVITPADAFISPPVAVTVQCATPGAKIHYTLDGNPPGKAAPGYRRPLQINQSTELRVQAFKANHRPSREAQAKFRAVKRKPGVQYWYFSGKWDKLPNFINLEPVQRGVVSHFGLAEIETAKEHFALLMLGFVKVSQAGKYTFFCGSNDGSQLSVNNQILIENDELHGFRERSAAIVLTPGTHLVEVRYFQGGGTMRLTVSWQGPDFEKRELAAQDFLEE